MPKEKRTVTEKLNKPYGYSLSVPVESREKMEEEDLYVYVNVLFRCGTQFKKMRAQGFEILEKALKRILPSEYEISDNPMENEELKEEELKNVHLDLTETQAFMGDAKINTSYKDIDGFLIKKTITTQELLEQNISDNEYEEEDQKEEESEDFTEDEEEEDEDKEE